MALKTGMLVGVVGTDDMGVLIQIRESSRTCVIKLNNGALKKNVPLADVEEARDMTDTKENKSPIRLEAATASAGGEKPAAGASPPKSVAKPGSPTQQLAPLAAEGGASPKSKSKRPAAAFEVGDKVKARHWKTGDRWAAASVTRVRLDGTLDVEFDDGQAATRVGAADVAARDEGGARTKASPSSSSLSPKKTAATQNKPAFEVGDAVQARYKSGKRFFPGKISAVNLDGSYNVTYDDGDTETRVAESLIEAASASSADPKKGAAAQASDAFRVNQAVRARYKKGSRWFPGKIKRVHADGTFDVLYDDGDVETRVDRDLIESAEERDNAATTRRDVSSPSKVRAESKPSASTSQLSVGDAVKARYKKGSKLFPGKIAKVRTDGTFDVRYDDGDVEMRVERGMIERVGGDGGASDAKPSDDDKKASGFQVGDSVQAYFKGGRGLFPGKITKKHPNGTFDVTYDDGDSEQKVPADLIQPVGSSSKSKADKRPTGSTVKGGGFSKGDKVKARYKGGAKYFPGTITRLRDDDTFDVEFDDGDVETRVEAARIEAATGAGGKKTAASSSSLPKKSAANGKYEVGDAVKARYKNGKQLFPGKIARVHQDGTYDVRYDDGDVETRVSPDLINGSEPSKPEGSAFQVGDRVKRTRRGERLAGIIHRVRRDGTFDVKYEDGELETEVEANLLDRETSTAGDPPEKAKLKRLEVGAKIRARYKGGSKLFNGEIVLARTDGTFDVKYEDGDSEKHVEADFIEVVDSSNSEKAGYEVGQSVEAYYNGGKKLFSGKITRVHSDGTFDIKYTDGDSESRVPASRIVADQAEKQPKRLDVGDKVKARYKGGDTFFPGTIARVHSNGTYDVKYDDGDSETRVGPANVVALREGESAKRKEQESTGSLRRLEAGDAVNARYKGGAKRFAGEITRVRSDGTYDVRYNDGDIETSVGAFLIEPRDRGRTASSKAGKPESKSGGYKTGVKVRARYQKGSRWFSGKILKARSDGTFDVRYDDGDEELRVSRDLIELLKDDATGKAKPTKDDDDDLFGDDGSGDDNQSSKPKQASAAFKKGDAVEANFKRKGKFHRGKIVQVHSDGSCDIEYDAGASEKRVDRELIRRLSSGNDGGSDHDSRAVPTKQRVSEQPGAKDSSSRPDDRNRERKSSSPKEPTSDAEGSSRQLQAGVRVAYRKATDAKSRRIGTVHRVHCDGSCDIVYADGETSKRVDTCLLLVCSDSEGSSDEAAAPKHRNKRPAVPLFRRHQRILSNWRRQNKFATPRRASEWKKATILAVNADDTYTIRYEDGTTEEDAPVDALKAQKKHKQHQSSSTDTSGSDRSSTPRRRRKRHRSAPQVSSESLYLLKQLALTLIEEGQMPKRGQAGSSSGSESSSSSDSSSSSSSDGNGMAVGAIDKAARKLFDARTLLGYRNVFKAQDSKGTGEISRSRIVEIAVRLCAPKKSSKKTRNDASALTPDDESPTRSVVEKCLTEWFDSHDDLRTHKRFDFATCLLAFAVAKHRLGKLGVEQAVASALDGRFASEFEYRRQLQLWQQKLGFRVFETLQRLFHEQALPSMIPSRVPVSALQGMFDSAMRSAVPSKPLEVYLQQLNLFPHQTLLLPEFLCCFYQLYGSATDCTPPVTSLTDMQTLELRPIAFVASCMFANGDAACQRHGDLVRRLCVGRTPSQQDLILKFREVFESLINVSEHKSGEPQLLPTTQLAAFASKVIADPTLMAPAVTALCKRSATVSLIEVFASCGFIIDELTTAPTLGNAVEKMRMRIEIAEVRRIIGLVRNLCLKILRFPNNSDYWRIRADTDSFHRKIGRYDGATCLLEAAGFVEFKSTHFELRGARAADGRRVSALSRTTLDRLREHCVQLDAELALMDGVESVTAVIERIAEERARQSSHFSLEECRAVLKHLSLCIENVLKNPKDSRCWRIRQANPTYERQIGYLPFAADLMEAVGYDLVESTQGNIFVLRGTSPIAEQSPETMTTRARKPTASRPVVTASLSSFAFSSVSGQMEWFLWRRKQEIDSLLQGELQYYFGQASSEVVAPRKQLSMARSPSRVTAEIVKMYPYGTNAVDTFNKTTVQQRQLEMMRACFDDMDRDVRGYLTEADFAQRFPQWVDGPSWLRFDAFDIGCDSKLDFADFVAALGPLLDHQYELEPGKNSKAVIVTGDSSQLTLCEAVSRAVGALRLCTSLGESTKVLELVLIHLHRLLEEPANEQFWRVEPRSVLGNYLERFAPARELLRLGGFRSLTGTRRMESADDGDDDSSVGVFELTPQRVRFATSGQNPRDQQFKPSGLDAAVISSLQSMAAIVAGHYRGLKFPTVSDVGSVARALGGDANSCYSNGWTDLVELVFRCITNVVDHPEEERYRQLRTSTETYKKFVASVQGGENMLTSIGFRETDCAVFVLPFDASLDELQARHLEFAVGVCWLRCCANSRRRKAKDGVQQHRENPEEARTLLRKRTSQPVLPAKADVGDRCKGRQPMRTTSREGSKRV